MENLRKIEMGKNPEVAVKVSGNLHARSWDEATIGVLSYREELIRVERGDSDVRILCSSDCDIFLPVTAIFRVERVGGDAYIRDIQTKLLVQKVGGNLTIQNVPTVEIERIGGDCRLQAIHELLTAHRISGELRGDDISGLVRAETVRGDVNMDACGGDFNLQSSGDIHLGLCSKPEGAFTLRAKGDVCIYIPDELEATFEIETPSRNIEIDNAGTREQINEKEYSFVRGNGGVALAIYASGDVRITNEEMDQGRLDEVFARADRHWSRIEQEGEFRFHEKIWVEDGNRAHLAAERMAERARKAAERIERRAQKKVKLTFLRLEKELPDINSLIGDTMQTVMGDLNEKMHGFSEDIRVPPPPPKPPIPPEPPVVNPNQSAVKGVTNEERMKILQMVQENKITPDQAIQLLNAISGK